MARILFVTWDGGGNVSPMLGVAEETQRRGHVVRFLGHPQQRASIETAGFAFAEYRQARPWSATAAATGLRGAAGVFALFTDPGPGRDVRAEVDREPVDLAVVDCMSLSALREAQHLRLPTAVLMHTFRHYLTARWARGPIGAIGALRGVRPNRLWNAADLVLVAADQELDPAGRRAATGTNVRYTGIVQPPPRAAEDDPLILVSLSTVYYEGQDRTLQAVLDGLADVPLRAVVTTGPAIDPGSLRPPTNAQVVQRLPHADLMPSAALVIGHGGHGTAMRALAHGVPMLILPMHPMLDHPMVGQVVVEAGAGIMLKKTAAPEQIHAAVTELLTDPSYRSAAANIGTRLRDQHGAAAAADALEPLVHATTR